MRKLIAIVCILSGITKGFSQLQKDNILLGTSASYQQNKTDNSAGSNKNTHNFSDFTGSLRAGYFIRNNFVVGLTGDYTKRVVKSKDFSVTTNGEQTNDMTTERKVYSIGGFTRLYKPIVEKKLAFFCQLNAAYQTGTSSGTTKATAGNSVFKNKMPEGRIQGFDVDFHPGFVYFIKERIGIEASFGTFGYNYQVEKFYVKNTRVNQTSTGGMNVNLGFNRFTLGVSFYLGEKRK